MVVKLSSKNVAAGRTSGDQNSDNLDFLDLPDSEIEELQKLAATLSDEDIHLLFDMTLKGVNDVVRALDPRVVLEMVLIRLTQAPRLQSIQALLEGNFKPVAAGSGSGVGGSGGAPSGSGGNRVAPKAPTPMSQPKPASTAVRTEAASAPKLSEPASAQQSAPAPAGEKSWDGFVDFTRLKKPLLGAKLEYAAMAGEEAGITLLKFSPEQEFFYSQLNQPEALRQLKEVAQEYFGKAMDFRVETKKNKEEVFSPREMKDKVTNQAQADLKAKVEAHPLIIEAKNILNAQITSIQTNNATRAVRPHSQTDINP
jgi:DNA polymerase-3 subunit gamma/tau